VHGREVLCSDPPIVFPGNVQARHFAEAGPKGATVVTVRGSRVVGVEPRWLDVVRFCRVRVDVSEARTIDQVLQAASGALGSLLDGDDDPNRVLVARLTLDGVGGMGAVLSCPPERLLRCIRQSARRADESRLWVERVRVRAGPPVCAAWTIAPGQTAAGSFGRMDV
jgi:hypothetical protein